MFLNFFSLREMEFFTSEANANNSQLDRLIEALKETRIDLFKADVLRSIAFLTVAFVTILLYKTKTISNNVLIYVLGIFMIIDLWGVDKRYVNNNKEKGQYTKWEKKKDNEFAFLPNKAQLTILERELALSDQHPGLKEKVAFELEKATDEAKKDGRSRLSTAQENNIRFRTLNFNSDFRVLNISVSTFNDASTSYFFKSLGGYHGAKLQSYQEMIEFEIQPEIQELVSRLQNGVPPHIAFENMNALNMLNTQYLIYNSNSDPVENPNRLGSAWFVNTIKWVTSAEEEIQSIKDNNPAEIAIIRDDFSSLFTGINPTTNSDRTINLIDYKPNRLIYEAEIFNSELAVFSEIYYPKGWKATIDGKESEIIRVNYILRGLVIPSGKHKIEFYFDPPGYTSANMVSLISSSLLILFALYVLGKLYSGNLRGRIE